MDDSWKTCDNCAQWICYYCEDKKLWKPIPCPHCGGNAHLDFAHGSNQSYLSNNGFAKSTPILYMVFCDECYTRTIACENSKIAIQLWNRRAE